MAISRLETGFSPVPPEPIRRKKKEPLRLDLIHIGTEVITYLAEKKGLSYEEATAPRKGSTSHRIKVQGKILDEYIKVVMAVPLPLTLTEHVVVMKSSAVEVTKRVNRVIRDSLAPNTR